VQANSRNVVEVSANVYGTADYEPRQKRKYSAKAIRIKAVQGVLLNSTNDRARVG
jgi:hypothetical protein